jgi:hypothetical protein
MMEIKENESMGKKAVLLLAAPFIVLAYVVALPFVLCATVAALAARKLGGAIYNLMGNLVSFSWRPDEAYLGGKKRKKEEKKKGDSPNDS